MQRVSLIVVQQPEAVAEREIRQAAIDIPEAQRQLVGIGQINLTAIANAGRAKRKFPPIDACSLNRHRKKHIGVIQVRVIKEITSSRQEIVRIDCPSMKRNRHTELVLLIPLSMQRYESKILIRN